MPRQIGHKSIIGNEKGMVLVVTLIMIAVLVLLGTTAVMTVTTDMKIAANYREGQKALFNAEAGVGQVIAYLRANTVTYPTTSTPTTTITVSCPTGFNFNTSVVIYYVAPNKYKFQMTGTGANNASKTIEAHIGYTTKVPAGTDGAVAMYGGGPAVQFKTGVGGGYAVDGRDYPVPASPTCNGSACATTATALPATAGLFTTMAPTLSGNVGAHLTGTPTQAIGTSHETAYQDLVNYVLTNNLYQSTLGTRAAPAITLVPNGTTLNGNGNGAGIIIVDDGGSLNLNGTFEFEGIIILRGTGRVFGTGTANLFGSLITIGHSAKLIDLSGGVDLNYSSAAIANLANINSLNTTKQTAWRDVF
ncbi:MAG: pilus assembly PilX N-terminal domain-containing protein [Deltaproteobacteria bacterium]|nr:pilus assembly PilX N-terminal domain-containing protein [Deltaproteobacteria bacterium]